MRICPFSDLFIMICWGVADLLAKQVQNRLPAKSDPSRIVVAIACIAILIALAVVTHRQIDYWKDDVTLWSHAVQVTTGNHEAETYLGQALVRRENPDAAIPHFQAAIAMYPAGATAYLFLGYAEQKRGDLREAIAQYQKATRPHPKLRPGCRQGTVCRAAKHGLRVSRSRRLRACEPMPASCARLE